MVCAKSINLSACLFKIFQILPLPCDYTLSFINFTVNTQEKSKQNQQCIEFVNE
jgi:hypothetical protein